MNIDKPETDEHANLDLGENNEAQDQQQDAPLPSGYTAPETFGTGQADDDENPLMANQNTWQAPPEPNYRNDRQQSAGMNSGQWGMYRQPTLLEQQQMNQGQPMQQFQNQPTG